MASFYQRALRKLLRLTRPSALRDAWAALGRALRGRPAPPADRPAAPPAAVAQASFTTHAFSNDQGARDYKLYIPAVGVRAGEGPAPHARPLVVMLHGCTQNPDDFAAGTGMNRWADERGFAVLYPAQRASANGAACWNWFREGDQHRGEGEPAILTGMVAAVVREHGLDAARVYAAGLSAGGAMAATLAATYPDVYAAIGVHSGLPWGAAHDVMSAFGAMRQGPSGARPALPPGRRVPTIVVHGDADATVSPRNGQLIVDDIQAALGVRSSVEREAQPAAADRHAATLTRLLDADGRVQAEHWLIHGGTHAWTGGSDRGTYTDPLGPDASQLLLRFFDHHRLAPA